MRLLELYGGRHLRTTLVLAAASAAGGALTGTAVFGGHVARAATTDVQHPPAAVAHRHPHHAAPSRPTPATQQTQRHPSPKASPSRSASARPTPHQTAVATPKPAASTPAASPSAATSPSSSPAPSTQPSTQPSSQPPAQGGGATTAG